MRSIVWVVAGLLTVLSVWLSQASDPRWLLLAVVVGAYLVVSGYTGTAPVEKYFQRKFRNGGDSSEG